jgi:hypothetical protein
MTFYIIDSLSPFFISRILRPGQVVNWSKVPFGLIERNGLLPSITADQIIKRFVMYSQRVNSIGFNAISIDDLAHIADYPDYSVAIRQKIHSYRILYGNILASAEKNNLDVFFNTDASFSPSRISENYKQSIKRMIILCRDLFVKYPSVKGVILRIGECDGVDVRGDLPSGLAFRTIKQTRELLLELLPLFKIFNKVLIFRTWTVGAFEIGDLIWNTATYDKLLSGLSFDNLVISHKYGDSDFFRYLKLNSLIFRGEHKKIVEFQTRREYEGFGEFPSFTGYDFEHYARQLEKHPATIGIHVWCQTGGWSRFHNCTYMPESSLWNEINTETTIDIFRNRMSAEEAVQSLCQKRFKGASPYKLIHLLKLSDLIIKKIWYFPEFSNTMLYIRRLRIPPLMWIFWDTVIINPVVRQLVRKYTNNTNNKSAGKGETSEFLTCIEVMKQLAIELGIPAHSLNFQYETFTLLLTIREYYLGDCTDEILGNIQKAIVKYTKDYPYGFCVAMNTGKLKKKWKITDLIFNLVIRKRSDYRLIEKKVFDVAIFLLKPILHYVTKKKMPSIASERAMGYKMLLK